MIAFFYRIKPQIQFILLGLREGDARWVAAEALPKLLDKAEPFLNV